jgi:hypothetical protein
VRLKLFEEFIQPKILTDSKGQPLELWHGARQKFDKFDMSWFGQTDEGFYGRGFYFTPDKSYAKEYGKLVKCHIYANNPFWLRSWNSIGSPIELDLRDDLATLNGIPKDIKTNRKLPAGYSVKRTELKSHQDDVVEFVVMPNRKFYGTDKEIYGPEVRVLKTELTNPEIEQLYIDNAIVMFNDMINNIDYDSGLPNWLLQKVNRNNFTKILSNNNYDCLAIGKVENNNERPKPEDMEEFLIWNPDQIEIIKWY